MTDLRSGAITAIYDAALTSDLWVEALDRMVAATSAKCSILYDFGNMEILRYQLNTLSSHFNEDMQSAYHDLLQSGRGSGFDEEGLLKMQRYPALKAIRDDKIYDFGPAYVARPEVALCRDMMGFFRRRFVRLADAPTDNLGLIYLYDSKYSEFPEDDTPTIEMFAPHVARAIEVHRLTQPLREKYNAALAVLDMIDLPILIFGADGALVLKNRAAGDVLSNRDALWEGRDGRLVLRDENAGAEMAEAISQVSRTARGAGQDGSVDLEIARGPKTPPLYALVSPLRDAAMELEKGLSGAIVTLIDPLYPVRPRVDLLAAAYGMTASETQVAELMATGLSNPEMAEATSVSRETVKTHVATILRKTGSRNRMAFLWRVFQFAPPVR